MTYTFWSSNTGGDGPNPPDPPGSGNSLRFRNNAASTYYLHNPNLNFKGDQTYTLSYWMKKATGANPNTMNIDPFNNDTSAGGTPGPGVHHSASGGLAMYSGSGFARGYPGDPQFRDQSAWYHFVHSRSFDKGWETWVNGVSLGTVEVSNLDGAGGTYIMRPWGGGQVQYGCYLSDYYCIDGQYLQPTAFGRFNEDGVWVPREVDFTPAKLQYSDFVYGTTSSTYEPNTTEKTFLTDAPGFGPTRMFDGNPNTECKSGTGQAQTWIYWRPQPAIENVTSLVVRCSNTQTVRINGGAPTGQTNGGTDDGSWDLNIANPPSTLTEVAIQGNSISSASIYSVTVNGKVLTNSDIWSADVYTYQGSQDVVDNGPSAANLASTEKNFAYPASTGFDGNPGAYFYPNTGLAWLWRPSTPITGVKKIEIRNGSSEKVWYNGIASSATGTDTRTTFYEGDPITLETLTGLYSPYNADAGSGFGAIWINGQMYIDGVNPSYGPNGWHLTFEDPQNVGLDTSGNNNHFNATGFDTTQFYSGDYNWNSNLVDSPNNTIPTALNDPPYWIDLVPNASGSSDNKWCSDGSDPYAWSNGNVNAPGGTNGTYIYGSGQLFQDEMTFDLRDFDTVRSAAIWGGWNQPDGSTTSAAISLLDENKNIIPGTTVNPVRVGDGSTRVEMCNTDVGGRYIKFDLSAPGSYFFLYGIEINGGLITQNLNNTDYDLMKDGPAQNYPKFNPLYPLNSDGKQEFKRAANSNGLLQSASSAGYNRFFFGTIKMPKAGKYYFEHTRPVDVDSNDPWLTYPNVGFTTIQDTSASESTNTWYNNISMAGGSGYAYRYGTSTYEPYGSQQGSQIWKPGQVIGCTYDADSGEVRFYKNGIDMGLMDTLPKDEDFYLAFTQIYNHGAFTLNCGEQPFAFTPPEGFVALQTANLPDPTITDGRDHFQAITGQGNGTYCYWTATLGSGPADQAGLGEHSYTVSNTPAVINGYDVVFDLREETTSVTFDFSQQLDTSYVYPGWMVVNDIINGPWINKLSQNTDPNGVITLTNDTPFRYVKLRSLNNSTTTLEVENLTPGGISPILGQAKATFPDGMWWIKDLTTSDNHQLIDSVRGGDFVLQPNTAASETSYVPPAGNSIAYCWKAGDTTVTDNKGTIESQVTVNHEAGFSIVQWVGNGGFGSVGHGLGKRPGMVICRTRQGDHWVVGVDGVTLLSSGGVPDQWVNNESFVTTNWQDAVLLNSYNPATTYYASSGINVDGNNMMAYVFTPIPGYSAFGKYSGNTTQNSGAIDGPFIYTGFRPAFVMIKAINSSENWRIIDTTVNPNNSSTTSTLQPNTTSEVDTNSSLNTELLSNGFKLRNSNANLNAQFDYLYCAFAENPFGGSNVSPVNAR